MNQNHYWLGLIQLLAEAVVWAGPPYCSHFQGPVVFDLQIRKAFGLRLPV